MASAPPRIWTACVDHDLHVSLFPLDEIGSVSKLWFDIGSAVDSSGRPKYPGAQGPKGEDGSYGVGRWVVENWTDMTPLSIRPAGAAFAEWERDALAWHEMMAREYPGICE